MEGPSGIEIGDPGCSLFLTAVGLAKACCALLAYRRRVIKTSFCSIESSASVGLRRGQRPRGSKGGMFVSSDSASSESLRLQRSKHPSISLVIDKSVVVNQAMLQDKIDSRQDVKIAVDYKYC